LRTEEAAFLSESLARSLFAMRETVVSVRRRGRAPVVLREVVL
jgi:hypothetical protein